MKTIIVSRFNSEEIIYESEKETVQEAVIEAVSSNANLRGASLCNANLLGASLCNANMREAKLCGRGGRNKLAKEQVPALLLALGFVVEE